MPVAVAAIALAPLLLTESRAGPAGATSTSPGAVSVTAGLMLLVYATTRATNDGWGAPTTLALFATAVALVLAFVLIELRTRSPLLPLRIFRLRTLSAANGAMAVVGAVVFSEFFVLTLYLQDVLRYSAVQTGAAFAAFALSVVVVSNVAQAVVGRVGVRATTTACSLPCRSPGHPTAHRRALLLGSLPGLRARWRGHGPLVRPGDDREPHRCRSLDAGVASGLINTSRQIGGALGLAMTSAVAAAATSHYAASHPAVTTSSSAALNHGYQTALYVLTGLLLIGAVIAVTLLRPAPAPSAEVASIDEDVVALDEAA